jgi:hypothetical protein
MARNDNWGSLPDYSHQNHTLKFARKSRNSDTYHDLNDNIPPMAWVGAAAFVGICGALLFIGHAVGF